MIKKKNTRAREIDFLKKNNDIFCDKGKVIFKCVECEQGVYDDKAYLELPLIQEGVTSHFPCPNCGTHLALVFDADTETLLVIDDVIMFEGNPPFKKRPK